MRTKKQLIPFLLLLLCSCDTSIKQDRADVYLAYSSEREDLHFESIELDEVKKYAFDFKSYIASKGVYYSNGAFDCEDYVRGLIAYVMVHHKYTLAPAIGQCKIIKGNEAHMLLVFNDKQGNERYFDVQLGKERRNVDIIYRRY